MASNNFRIKNGANIQPSTTAASEAGDIRVDSGASNALKYFDTAERTVVNTAGTQTLTNKTLTSPAITTPTGIVKGDVGLGNVDNTSDATKNAASVTLTNKTLTSPVINTPTGIVKGDVGLGNVDNTSDASKNAAAVTLTNKTITAPIITTPTVDVVLATDQGGAPATPSAGTHKVYAKSDGLYILDSSGAERKVGSGAGSINYASNPDFEGGTTSFNTYKDAAGTSPVDGTAGSPTHITISASSSSPLRGAKSLLISNSGSSTAQGEGVSYDFTIDSADKAKPLYVTFDYTIASGTFVGGTGAASPSDVTVWVYDVTNAAVIQLAPYVLEGNQSTTNYRWVGMFQTASNSTSYRLIFHVGSTNTSAWGLKVDNLSISPTTSVLGAAITDMQSYTPTFVGFGTVSGVTAQYRRVGDSMHLQLYWVSGIATAVTATVTLPFGTVDSTKASGNNNVFGYWSADTNAAGAPTVIADASASLLAFGLRTGSTSGMSKALGNAIASNGQNMSLFAVVPITGWSSNVVMSTDTDTRVVAFRGYKASGTQTVTTTPTIIAIDAVEQDTHGGFNTSTSIYTIQVPGFYDLLLNIEPFTGSTTLTFYTEMYVNSVLKERISESATTSYDRSAAYPFFRYFNAGDTVQFKVSTSTGTISLSAGQNGRVFSLARRSGPSVVAASESVNALYESNTVRSISNSAATTGEFLMEDKIFDSHNAYNTSTAIYTCPAPGKYRVGAMVELASSAGWDRNELLELRLYKNAALNRSMGGVYCEVTNTLIKETCGSTLVSCVAGDTLEVRVFQGSGGAINTSADQTKCWVSYERIGS